MTKLGFEEKQLPDKWAADWARYLGEDLQPAVAALRAGRKDEVERHLASIVETHIPALRSGTAALTRMQIDTARQEYEGAVAQYAQLRNATVMALVIAMIVSGLFAFITVRGIGVSVHELEQAATRMADGDLTAQAKPRGNDELARIARAFNRLSERFRQSLGKVSASTAERRLPLRALRMSLATRVNPSMPRNDRSTSWWKLSASGVARNGLPLTRSHTKRH